MLFCICILSITASGADEQATLNQWLGTAILGQAQGAAKKIGLDVRRQDYAKLNLRQSVMNTPLQIGAKKYERGLGTHAVSEIVVNLPQPATAFSAEVGVDNNYDTKGTHGTVVFVVEAGGKELFRSQLCHGGDAPVPVLLKLDNQREVTLRVLDGGDGPNYDQADWSQASVTLADGKTLLLDDLPLASSENVFSSALPFSFVYGGKSSAEFLASWKRQQAGSSSAPGGGEAGPATVRYTDPATGLEVTCELRSPAGYAAADWVLYFKNTGMTDTPLIENIQPLDVTLTVPSGEVLLRQSHGSTCAETDFLPLDQKLGPNANVALAPNGGRSSDGRLPFFNLEWLGGGLAGAVGWTGQWALTVKRDAGAHVNLRMGQQSTHFVLHPGEQIRTPRVVLLHWQGADRLRGHNQLRRLILDHYTPKRDGQPMLPPVTQNTWFTFAEGNKTNEPNQLEAMEVMAKTGVEGYWLDAGWFEGGWPAGAGNWVPKADAFPRGLKPLGDAAHAKNMKFVLWFEPERVTPNSRIAKEHPEWVLHAGGGDGLFNMGDPAARAWLTELLSKCVSDWGMDVYRNDFNIDPLRFWQAADKSDRKGITEIRYIEGLYAMWDELLKRHPGLSIDNCSSGGRRIDIEMLTRSYPLWRSDTQCCGAAKPVWDQVQTAGLSLYVPLHAAGVWEFEPYAMRSVATTGMSLCMNTLAKEFDLDKAIAGIKEVKALRSCYRGDYYPLLEIDLDERHWCGWQFDRPESGEGFAVFFRRAQSAYTGVSAQLRGLDLKASYEVTFFESYVAKEKRTLRGEELAQLSVQIDSKPGSLLVTYRKK
ncbi:MAG TPA: alpha-galactosidase [Planctomycetota bacterium]